MEKTFRIYNGLLNFVFLSLFAVLLVVGIYFRTIDGFGNGIDIFGFILALFFIVWGLVYNLSAFTYKFVVNDNEVWDKDIFHGIRRLAMNDIEWIRPRAYAGNIYKRIYGRTMVEAPAFTNGQFSNFPRYRISKDIVKYMHTSHPEVKIDANYSNLIAS